MSCSLAACVNVAMARCVGGQAGAASGASAIGGSGVSPVAAASEYQVKAAFLFGLAKFIEWPEASFASVNAPFAVCVVGEDPFGAALEDALQGKRIQNRNVAIARFANASAIGAGQMCQVVFVSASEKQKYRETLARFRGESVLLVGDAGGFATAGGAIEFMLDGGHVRFLINPAAVDRAGLRVSSKLLALAKIVREEQKS
jgi:hypothetical protein